MAETLRDVIPTVEMISILTLLFNSVEQVKVRSDSGYLSVSLLFCFVYFQIEKEKKGECTRVGTGIGKGGGVWLSCVTPKKATRISRKKLKSLKAALTISI